MSVGASPPNPPNPTPPPLAPDPAALRAFARRADAIVGPLGAPAVPAGDRLLSQLQLSSTVRDAVVAQFLRARLGDVARAARLLEDAVAWRARPEVLRPGGRECVERPEAAFPFRLVGGVAGSVVVYGALRLMERSVMDREAFLEATVAWLESVYAEFYECIDVIVDLEDWSLWRHTSKHVYSVAAEGLALLQSYYPDRLGRVFVVRYPTTMKAAWTVIRPLIDAGPRAKIFFVPDESGLTEYLPRGNIPDCCGGDLPLKLGI